MNFNYSDEQNMLKESVAKLLAMESSSERVRGAEVLGFDSELWCSLHQMGLSVMRVPERAGGLGSSLLDAAIVSEECGRYLASVPLIEHLAVSGLVAELAGSSEKMAEVLAAIVSGKVLTFYPSRIEEDAAVLIPYSTAADYLLLAGEKGLYLLEGGSGSKVDSLSASASAEISLSSLGLEPFVTAEVALDLFDAACDEWRVLTAAALAGLAEQGLRLAAEYANERQAFGRAISGFQGVSHPLADHITRVEGSQLFTRKAIWALAQGLPEAAANISMAFWWAAEISSKAMASALHTFGGYGVSLEYDIQLYYRRAKAWAAAAGDPQRCLLDAADRLWPEQRGAQLPSCLPAAGANEQDYSLGEAAQEFGEKTKAFFDRHMTDELREHAHHSVDGFHPEFNKIAASENMLFPHWPKIYGGQDRTVYEMAAMTAVIEAQGWEHVTAPITNQVAHAVMQFGTPEVKDEALSRFGSGESLACMGFTEPSCGCDIFAAKTTVLPDQDGEWVINGQKIFTTAANVADYCFLLARTNTEKSKHAGLSVFLVPMDLPGIEVHAVYTLQDERTNIVYFSDVKLPKKYLIGELDKGLSVMAATLEMEHGSADQYRQAHVSMLASAEKWATEKMESGRAFLADNQRAARLARAKVHLEVSTVLSYRAIWLMAEKISNRYWGPMAKLFVTEYYRADADDLMDLCAPYSLVQQKHGLGHVEIGYRQSIGTTIYGGTSEIQRSLVAEQALGLAKSRS